MTAGRRHGDPYAGQPGRRTFVAVPLPADAVASLTRLVDAVRGQPLPDGLRDVRWVRLDGLHLTVRFLGPTLEPRLAPTADAVARVAAVTAPIDVRLAGAGTFPGHGRPRTLWIGVGAGQTALAALAATLDVALADVGWAAETRPFKAHLTLARADGLAAGPLVAARLVEALGDVSIDAALDRLVLYESVTGGGPARYVPLTEAAFGG